MRLLGLAPIGIRAFQRIFKRGGRSEGCSAILSMTIAGVSSVHVMTQLRRGISTVMFLKESFWM